MPRPGVSVGTAHAIWLVADAMMRSTPAAAHALNCGWQSADQSSGSTANSAAGRRDGKIQRKQAEPSRAEPGGFRRAEGQRWGRKKGAGWLLHMEGGGQQLLVGCRNGQTKFWLTKPPNKVRLEFGRTPGLGGHPPPKPHTPSLYRTLGGSVPTIRNSLTGNVKFVSRRK